jgi:hypothetical protein
MSGKSMSKQKKSIDPGQLSFEFDQENVKGELPKPIENAWGLLRFDNASH